MKTKILMLLLFVLVAPFALIAQSHNLGPNYNCKLQKKDHHFNSEKLSCPACKKKREKEDEAVAVERKRRDDVLIAKDEAQRITAEKLRAEKIRLANEEQKRIKDKELADKIATENARKRYKEIAENGIIKSGMKGKAVELDLSQIECFRDKERRVYGFKINGEEVMIFNYEESSTYIDRLKNTNLFEVSIWGKHPNGWEKYLRSFIIDYSGNKLSVNGISEFDYPVEINTDLNILYLYKKLSVPESVGNKCSEARTFGSVFQSKEAALADISKGTGRICITTSMVSAHVKVYSVDFSQKLINQVNGYVILSHLISGLYK